MTSRVGFTLPAQTDDEIILGDADKHLNVKLSLCKLIAPAVLRRAAKAWQPV